MKKIGRAEMPWPDKPYLKPLTEAGSVIVSEDKKAYLDKIIQYLNDLFGTDTTNGDQVS